jgi:cytoskeletal protein CcmA (bactofilin family)
MSQRVGNHEVLPYGVSITGHLSATEDITIHGRFDGQIVVPEHQVTVEPSAFVKAKIVARQVMIAGTVDGTIIASERVRMMPGSSVTGHLMTPAVTLADGAQFTGTIDPERTQAAVQVAKYKEKNT